MRKTKLFRLLLLIFLLAIVGLGVLLKVDSGFLSIQNATKWTLSVSVVNLVDKKPITYGRVVVYNPRDKLVSKQEVDEKGTASFSLPEGVYRVKMESGFTGEKEVNLNSDLGIELGVLMILN